VPEVDFAIEATDETAELRERLANRRLARDRIRKQRRDLLAAFEADDEDVMTQVMTLGAAGKALDFEIAGLERELQDATMRDTPDEQRRRLADLRQRMDAPDRFTIRW
jgi:hypothetical protein